MKNNLECSLGSILSSCQRTYVSCTSVCSGDNTEGDRVTLLLAPQFHPPLPPPPDHHVGWAWPRALHGHHLPIRGDGWGGSACPSRRHGQHWACWPRPPPLLHK